ncbi:hypothetical protein ACFYXM_13935 [Streptomyces sp. NPDC002476]|uniref:hypothetical protein n=1 Tax=Streptomyces sp. NPDC002476 TaxID=3364648 RepID=UPI0036D0A019
MTTWGLVMETTVGGGENKHIETYVLAHMAGTREDALLELERRARGHAPTHPRNPKRRRLFRKDDGFLLVVDGAWQSYSTRFTVAELLEDSAAPEPEPAQEPEPAPDPRAEPEADTIPAPAPSLATATATARESARRRRAEHPAEEDVERYADGVPVRPAWLGRPDLP